mmetsp:Transcript_104211/g.222741  ORF Transcript_104211/g.222741 Transcript_104211/m.222741 type:complete len:482 (-) Transcript_104211:95-1540(-)
MVADSAGTGANAVAETGPASAGVTHINQHGKDNFQGVLECRWTEMKGRILHATREFRQGEVILAEAPLHIVQEQDDAPAFRKLKALCEKHQDDFDYDPLWYWCALQSLTKEQIKGAKHGGWAGAAPEVQRNLLLLHHEDVKEAGSASEILVRDLATNADAKLIERLTQIWVLNCFEYSDNPQGFSTYFFSSFMSHSCFPNAVWHYTGTDHVLRARRDIRIGDEVCISYLPEHGLLNAAPTRRMELYETKHFWCDCERCRSGLLDLSRGFVCPKCRTGVVFAQTPCSGPAKDGSYLASQLSGATCSKCAYRTNDKDAKKLAAHEKRLKEIVDTLSQQEEDDELDNLDSNAMLEHEKFIDANFAQHVMADLAWEKLSDYYVTKHRGGDQRRLLERRCGFHAAAYPGLSGAHAWALEAHGDAMLRSSAAKEVQNKKKRVWQVAVKEEPEVAKALYTQALNIFKLMFGEDHEYPQAVCKKLAKVS